MTQITDFIPQYQAYSYAYSRFVDAKCDGYESLRKIIDFYNTYREIQIFERMILDLVMASDNQSKEMLLKSLLIEIESNVEQYFANEEMLDNMEPDCVTDLLGLKYDGDVEAQIEQITHQGTKLLSIFERLSPVNTPREEDDEKLWEEYDTEMDSYKGLINTLNELYQKQAECRAEAERYEQNIFHDLNELNKKFIAIIGKYVTHQTPKQQPQGGYFDMGTVSAIHKLCNNVQFDPVSELDLYAILNLQPTSAKIVVKPQENTRVCYLIYKLYEMLQTPDRAKWRTEILAKAGISESYYASKYKEPESDVPSKKSEQFAQSIKEILSK